jgi:hypothetical protein
MDMYAPADQPLVIFAGDDDDSSLLQSALSRLLGAVGILGVASLAIQQLYGESLFGGGGDSGAPGVSGGESAPSGGAAPPTDSPTPQGTPDGAVVSGGDAGAPEETVAETAAGGNGGDGGVSVMDTGGNTTVEPSAETTERVAEATATATETVTETAVNATRTATETAAASPDVAAGLPPGLLFFAGGLFAIALVAAVAYSR